jgi:hypothetical protein
VLLEGNDAMPPDVIKIKDEQARLIRVLKSGAEVSGRDKQILYDLLTYIGTKYTIEPAEQELLLLGGQLIVRLRQQQLEAALR